MPHPFTPAGRTPIQRNSLGNLKRFRPPVFNRVPGLPLRAALEGTLNEHKRPPELPSVDVITDRSPSRGLESRFYTHQELVWRLGRLPSTPTRS
jgi:hypothetical protein